MTVTSKPEIRSKSVFLIGEIDAVYNSLANRLERSGAILTVNREDADLTVSLGKISHTLSPPPDVAIIPAFMDEPIADLVVKIHDLLVPEGVLGWGTEIIHEWIEWVKSGVEGIAPSDIEARHWVHIRDASDALGLLILTDTGSITQGVIDLAGRRAWSSEAIIEEMHLLWNRYTDALNFSHSIESLSQIPSPVSHQSIEAVQRPDLSLLHNALKNAGTEEGWRPLTAMRVSLMELFAHSESEL